MPARCTIQLVPVVADNGPVRFSSSCPLPKGSIHRGQKAPSPGQFPTLHPVSLGLIRFAT